ncbi:MAG: hypothetical protein WDN76_08995 [Alphaproteobacteria bacterium]
MSLRIVDAELPLDQAYDLLHKTLAAWAGGKSQPWQHDGEEGASFSTRDDVYLFVMRNAKRLAIGAALTAKDKEIFRIEIPRKSPASDRKRAAIVTGEGGELFLMVSADELRRQDIREPFKRLAGAPNVKRATVSDRDYVLVGPLGEDKTADALLSLAALSPLFEKHVEQIAALAGQSDAREESELYTVSPRVAGAHRVHAKVVDALFTMLRGVGFQVAELSNGPVRADFAVARADGAIAFEIRADAELNDFLKALGQLALIAPAGGAFRRALVAPSPQTSLGGALAPLEATFRELGVWVLLYDFKDSAVNIWTAVAPADLPPELRKLFP